MSDLVQVADLVTLLGLSDDEAIAQSTLLDLLLTQAETAFLTAAHRAHLPFQLAQSARVEVWEGSGLDRLWLDYPVDTVTNLVIGLDLAVPDEELDPTDPTVVHGHVGSRELRRVDGGVWGNPVRPISYVQVTYDTQDDLPTDARDAVLQYAATAYRSLGTERVQSESLDNYSVTFARVDQAASVVPGWAEATARHRRMAAIC